MTDIAYAIVAMYCRNLHVTGKYDALWAAHCAAVFFGMEALLEAAASSFGAYVVAVHAGTYDNLLDPSYEGSVADARADAVRDVENYHGWSVRWTEDRGWHSTNPFAGGRR